MFAVMMEWFVDVGHVDAEHLSDFYICIFLALDRGENSCSEI
jgi:hypothetical protein